MLMFLEPNDYIWATKLSKEVIFDTFFFFLQIAITKPRIHFYDHKWLVLI